MKKKLYHSIKIFALALVIFQLLTLNVFASAESVLSLYKNKETDTAPFNAPDMLPGDNYKNEGMEHLKRNYRVCVSYNGTITVHFGVENIQTTSPAPSLADVLMCDIIINDDLKYEGVRLAELKDKDIPYTITGVNTTEDLDYEIGVYLDTSVGNAYKEKNLTADFVWWVEVDDDDDDGGSGGGGGGGGGLPIGPDTPVNPPVDPDNPDTPDTPDNPDDPDDPDNPDDPDIPGTPDDPNDPDSPHVPGTPGADPDNPDAPGTVPGDGPSSPEDVPGKPAPDKPEKPKGELIKPPNTGDFKHPLIYITGICVATFILFILVFVRKKTKNESNRTIRRLMIALAVVVILAICLCVTTFALLYSMVAVEGNFFSTATVKINLNNGDAIIDPDEFLFEPGMTVQKKFFIENESSDSVYYKIYFENIDGALADVLDVTISYINGGEVLYSGKARNLTYDNQKVGSGELGLSKVEIGEFGFRPEDKRHDLYATFYFPEESGNNMQNAFLQFDMYATATQKRNNLDQEVYREF